jgi:nonribosomal peptide synthetase DhbF
MAKLDSKIASSVESEGGYVDDLLGRRAAEAPDRPAVSSGDETLSFRELNERANRLARYLTRRGCRRETLVGLVFGPSIGGVVAMLATLKTGAGFVTTDPAWALEHVADMLSAPYTNAIVTSDLLQVRLPRLGQPILYLEQIANELENECSDDLRTECLSSDGIACVLSRPATSGRPRGVVWTRGTLSAAVSRFESGRSYEPGERVGFAGSTASEQAILELLVPMLAGQHVVLVPRAGLFDLRRYLQGISDAGVTSIQVDGPILRQMLDLNARELAGLNALRRLTVGLLELTPDLVASVADKLPHVDLVGEYVSVESGGVALQSVLRGENCFIAGEVVDDATVFVLDVALNRVATGTLGEIYVRRSPGARGYLGDAALTAERFVADCCPPGNGMRLVRTGMIGRSFTDGRIEVVGPADATAELLGERVVLTEIETVLTKHELIRDAAVAVRQVGREDALVAYIATGGYAPMVSQIKDYLKSHLPAHMVPSVFVSVDEVPRTHAGMIHRDALPSADPLKRSIEQRYAVPRTAVETTVAAIWAEVLMLDRVGIHDEFLDLGGDSLLATQAAARMFDAFARQIPTQAFFDRGTVAAVVEEYLAGIEQPNVAALEDA